MQNNNGLKSYIIIAMGIVILGLMVMFIMKYNALVDKEEFVKESWSQVESTLQRKLDLLPNLVKVVKIYAKHEKELLTEIIALRSNAKSTFNQKNTSSKKDEIKHLGIMKERLDNTLLKLYAVAENYPDLKSSEQFLQLQSQIEGAENRINITRMQFNSSVSDFNAYIRKMPVNIISNFGSFQRKGYFKAEKKAHQKLELGL